MKVARYPTNGAGVFEVEYDETAPCRCCGEPVIEASMGGTDLCPACDCGYRRSPKCPPCAKDYPVRHQNAPD